MRNILVKIFRWLMILLLVICAFAMVNVFIWHLLKVEPGALERRAWGPFLISLAALVMVSNFYGLLKRSLLGYDLLFRRSALLRFVGVVIVIFGHAFCAFFVYLGISMTMGDPTVLDFLSRGQETVSLAQSGNIVVEDKDLSVKAIFLVGLVGLMFFALGIYCFRKSRICSERLSSHFPETLVFVERHVKYRGSKGRERCRMIVRLPDGQLATVYGQLTDEGQSLIVRKDPWSSNVYHTPSQWRLAGPHGAWRMAAMALVILGCLLLVGFFANIFPRLTS